MLNINNKEKKSYLLFLFLSIILLFFITRLTNLTILPIFNDEAIYIRWSMIMNEDIQNIWLPIQVENKKPVLMWLIAMALNVFQDPLWAARSISVFTGFFSLIGIIFIGNRLHSAWVGCLAGLLYTTSPYYLFYDRMAHQDSLLNCFFLWLLLLNLIIFQQEKKVGVRHYWLLGLVIGVSFLAKTTAILFVFLPLLLKFILLRKSNSVRWNLLLISYLLGLLIAALPYVSLFLTSTNISLKSILLPPQTSLGQKNIADVFLKIPNNFLSVGSVIDYFIAYLTIPVLFASSVFFILQIKVFSKKHFIILFYFLVPFFLILGIGGSGFSRYFLFCGTPILLWAAMAISYAIDFARRHISRKLFYLTTILIMSFIFSPSLVFNYKLITKPSEASLVGSDYSQYISNEFSGYGIPAALDYFRKVSVDKKIIIFTTPNWGNPADAMYIYLSNYQNISVYTAFWLTKQKLLPPNVRKVNVTQQYTLKKLKWVNVDDQNDVYFVCSSSELPRDFFLTINNNFQLVRSFSKPNSIVFIDIYKRTS